MAEWSSMGFSPLPPWVCLLQPQTLTGGEGWWQAGGRGCGRQEAGLKAGVQGERGGHLRTVRIPSEHNLLRCRSAEPTRCPAPDIACVCLLQPPSVQVWGSRPV